MTQQFRPHPIYYLLIVAMLLLSGLLCWGMRTGIGPGDLLFLFITLAAVGNFLSALMTSLTITESAIHLRRPLARWRNPFSMRSHGTQTKEQIAFRQLIRVDRAGRILPALTLLYHPLQPNGLVDMDRVTYVTLPMVTNQNMLQEYLEAVTPV